MDKYNLTKNILFYFILFYYIYYNIISIVQPKTKMMIQRHPVMTIVNIRILGGIIFIFMMAAFYYAYKLTHSLPYTSLAFFLSIFIFYYLLFKLEL